MGGCLSTNENSGRGNAERQMVSKAIDLNLEDERENDRFGVKLLLLGSGESGKSTILKQMVLLYGKGFETQDRERYRPVVQTNTINAIKLICSVMKTSEIPFSNPEREVDYEHLNGLSEPGLWESSIIKELLPYVERLWKDDGVQETYAKAQEYKINNAYAKFYLDKVNLLFEPNYLPSDEDILRSRIKTNGIVETFFQIGELRYKVVDVGGQRSERRKWIHCFEDVTAIVFVVAISEYDQTLQEDDKINRMQDALVLFDSTCNSRWFVNTNTILLLNKIDVFKSKVATVPLETHFTDIKDFLKDKHAKDASISLDKPLGYELGLEYFKQKFEKLDRSDGRVMYLYPTCATDTSQVAFVLAAINDTITQSTMSALGFV